jgi:hypothetical protein
MYRCGKMAGNRNSGRKKDPLSDCTRLAKKTFYVRQTLSPSGKWVDDKWFQWFKIHHGAGWQNQIRRWMRMDAEAYRPKKYWQCHCPNVGVMGNWVSRRVPQCPRCKQWVNDLAKLRYGGPIE